MSSRNRSPQPSNADRAPSSGRRGRGGNVPRPIYVLAGGLAAGALALGAVETANGSAEVQMPKHPHVLVGTVIAGSGVKERTSPTIPDSDNNISQTIAQGQAVVVTSPRILTETNPNTLSQTKWLEFKQDGVWAYIDATDVTAQTEGKGLTFYVDGKNLGGVLPTGSEYIKTADWNQEEQKLTYDGHLAGFGVAMSSQEATAIATNPQA